MNFSPRWPMKAEETKDLSSLDMKKYKAELKYDGRRGIIVIGGEGNVDFYSSTLKHQGDKLPHLGEQLLRMFGPGTILDCEYVVFKDGQSVELDGQEVWVPNFTYTAKMMGRKTRDRVIELEDEIGVKTSIVVFDIMQMGDLDLTQLTWLDRRIVLEKVDGWGEHVLLSQLIEVNDENLEKLASIGAEGLMLKYIYGKWHEGKRSWDWIKFKFLSDWDVIIVGFTNARDGSKYEGRAVGAIWYGQWVECGKLQFDIAKLNGGKPTLRKNDKFYILETRGKCAGVDDKLREDMYRSPNNYIGKVITVKSFAPVPGSHKPRMPQLKEFRDDKDSSECIWSN